MKNADFEYYYNLVPSKGYCRNNLIYTSLISKDKKVFCKWFYNDKLYHNNQNEVVDPHLMDIKWQREVKFLDYMSKNYPQHVPEIIDINYSQRKIYLRIEGPDLWEQAGCSGRDYSNIIPDWQYQMLDILQAYRKSGFYKYSLHPSSYFIEDGKLKSINYFFCYWQNEPEICVNEVLSHISKERQEQLFIKMKELGISSADNRSFQEFQLLALESFKSNYRDDFIESAKQIFTNQDYDCITDQ